MDEEQPMMADEEKMEEMPSHDFSQFERDKYAGVKPFIYIGLCFTVFWGSIFAVV